MTSLPNLSERPQVVWGLEEPHKAQLRQSFPHGDEPWGWTFTAVPQAVWPGVLFIDRTRSAL